MVTEVLSIDSEKVTEILSLTETELRLSVGEVEKTLGAVVSIVNSLNDKILLILFTLSVTLTQQSPYTLSLKAEPSEAVRLTVLSPATEVLSSLLQLPPYVMVPVSFELKV